MQTWKKKLVVSQLALACTLAIASQANAGNDSKLLIVFYVQIMPDDFIMQLHRF